MKTIIVTIPMRAVPKGSTHAFKHRSTGKIITLQNGADALYKYQYFVAYSCRRAKVELSEGAVQIRAEYHFQRPASHFVGNNKLNGLKRSAPVYHLQTPDLDKLDRAILDSLHDVAFNDDKQVVKLISSKHWDSIDEVILEITNGCKKTGDDDDAGI